MRLIDEIFCARCSFILSWSVIRYWSVWIGKNNNTRTVQTESSKFESVLFDQGFQILVGTDRNAIYWYFASIRLYLALLNIISISQEISSSWNSSQLSTWAHKCHLYQASHYPVSTELKLFFLSCRPSIYYTGPPQQFWARQGPIMFWWVVSYKSVLKPKI